MSETKEFWVPNELALEILGFNKNILEKRVNADYIKREVRSGIELLEISGEIERFGLSVEVAREKLNTYINKNGGESGEKKKVEVERPRGKTMIFEAPAFSENAGIPVPTVNIPATQPVATPNVAPVAPIKMVDYAPQLNKMALVLDDIRKFTITMPELISSKSPKENNLPNPQMAEMKQELSRLAVLTDQNLGFQKEIALLQAQLKTSNAEITRLSTQSNSVMDELERANQKHIKEVETLKSNIKSEIAGINSILTLKLRKPKGYGITILLLLIVGGAVGFLIYELMTPTYSSLAKPNVIVKPISKKDISDSVKEITDPLSEKLKGDIAVLNTQNKEVHQKELAEINAMITTSLDSQKETIKKSIEGMIQGQKDNKFMLDENYTKSLKAIETQVVELEKLIKRMLETTVQIKPGTKFIPDSNE